VQGKRRIEVKVPETLFRVAPEGRDVYSLAIFLLGSSVGAQSLCPGEVPLPGFAPNGARRFACVALAKNISLLWSEREIQLLHLKVEFNKLKINHD
jgi:hypothetical protein